MRRWPALALVVALLSGCGGGGGGGPAPAAPAAEESPGEASPLEGMWVGGEVTEDELVTGGLTKKEAGVVFQANEATSTMVTTLRLSGDSWQSFVSADGGPDVHAQFGTFTVEGDLIRMVDELGANYTYRYELDDDVLAIELIETDAGPSNGIRDEAFQYAHYEAEPFERQP
ncbi:MAG TPA: hypothetical protein VHL78_00115 [Actinomycetota bacterium]|nr:hypothetical protein [Actinomycetota bacterium]